MRNTAITGVCVALGLAAAPAWAQIAVSSNDHKVQQVNGVTSNADNPTPDSITEKATLDVAPRPYAVSITPDGKYAVVASLGDPKANGMFTVIDISGDQPKIMGTVDIGHESLEGAMMSNDGKWVAGVAHGGSTRPKDAPQFKPNGMLVMYRLDGDKLTKVSEAPIGAWSQGVSFSKDGKTVAAQNMIQKNIQVFKNDDGKITDTGKKIEVGGGAADIRS